MKKIKITNLSNSRYGLFPDSTLKFNINEEDTLELSKKAAVEIMWTLLDSENMLTKEMEEIIYEIEERIGN